MPATPKMDQPSTTVPAAPVAIELNGAAAADPAVSPPAAANIAVIVVTWNRKDDVARAVQTLSRQTYPRELMDVIVVDNASTDGTLEHLRELFRPDAVVFNNTEKAHEPNFQPPERGPGHANRGAGGAGGAGGGFRSLTIVRNAANLGGCGGFNTGFTYIDRFFTSPPPDFVWLADDDADFAADALEQLVRAARTDSQIGIVGSRTVDISDRRTTIETTIYFDRRTGAMCDDPPPHHPRYASHRQWIEGGAGGHVGVGGTKGVRDFHGLRDVDVVSACSLLARWSAVQKVGFWDWRYFIYCDDADWCLRMARAGYRVVLNLDAVVYHTPWLMKLTPARIYYAQRNAVWMMQKILPTQELRHVTLKWMATLLRDSLRASVLRRVFHAEIIRRTAMDIAGGRAGRTGSDGPPAIPLLEALRRAGCLQARGRPGRRQRVAIVCCQGERGAESLRWSMQLRRQVQDDLIRAGQDGELEPDWIEIVRNDVLAAAENAPDLAGPDEPVKRRIVYGRHWRSRLRRQWDLIRSRPRAILVIDQNNDFPAVAGRWNIHVDMKKPGVAQLERDGLLPRGLFLVRWMWAVVRCTLYAARVKPYTSPTRYG